MDAINLAVCIPVRLIKSDQPTVTYLPIKMHKLSHVEPVSHRKSLVGFTLHRRYQLLLPHYSFTLRLRFHLLPTRPFPE